MWGATVAKSVYDEDARDFNPRTHVGCDLDNLTNTTLPRISIHAPMWGATRLMC